MSIFNNLFGDKPRAPWHNFNFGNSTTTKSGEKVSPDDALEDATVLSCINTLAQSVAQLPLNVLNGDGAKSDSNFQKIISKPNNYQTSYAFKYAIVHSLMAYGNVYIRIVRTPAGLPVQLVLIEPDKMTVESNLAGMPVYKHEDVGDIAIDNIVHIQDIITFNAAGKSRVTLASERIGALKAADSLMAATFKNGVNIGYVLEVEPGMDKDKFDQLSKGFKDAFGRDGVSRGGATVLQGSKINAIKGSTPADADLLNLRERLINEVCAVFKVPASMAGGTGQEKYSNLRQSQTGFYRDTIAPLVDSIEQAINLKLGTPEENATFDVSLLLKGDIESQAKVSVQMATAGIWTPNEARGYVGYGKIEGGDELTTAGSTTDPDDERGSVDTPNEMNPEATGENEE